MKNYRRCIWSSAMLCWLAAVGCNLLPAPQTSAPTQNAKTDPEHKYKPERVSQFVFFSDVELSKKQPLFRELSEMREQIFTDLRLVPSTTPIQVHIFEDRDRYERFMQAQYPTLPKRRAFFAAKPKMGGDELLVYTYWSSEINQDLRHEITHALLHSVLKGVPIWLDEGLAEYYEMPPGWNGINWSHAAQLQKTLAGGQKFDLARLEKLEEVHEVNRGEYREAWAWVHFMMHSSPQTKNVLVHYLRDLKSSAKPGPLRPSLERQVPDLDATLERYVINLDQSRAIANLPRKSD
jgi:hypothetical protein